MSTRDLPNMCTQCLRATWQTTCAHITTINIFVLPDFQAFLDFLLGIINRAVLMELIEFW